ncbi:MAG: MATE family efflux transporter [Clostridia bacterium]|nr:MATE family efflux transporter [Clostridia bacterium]
MRKTGLLQKKEVDMTEGSVFRKIIAFALPLVLSNILQALYNAADMVVVGIFAGDLPLGAVGATSALTNLMLNLFIALSVGTSVTVATAIGAQSRERTQRLVHTSMALALVCGVFVTVLGLTCSRSFLILMDTSPVLLDMASAYMRIFFSGSIFSLVYNFGAAILRAAGDSRRPLYYLMISGVVNVVLNIFFVTVCGMTADGVALATVISQILSAVLVVRALLRHTGDIRLFPKKIRFYGREVWDILRTGLPAGVQSTMFSISNTMIQTAVNSFDNPLLVSGNTAAMNIEGFVFTAMYAMHVTAVTAMGQNIGAGKYHRMNAVMGYCLLTVAAIGLVMGGASVLFAEPLLDIYLTENEAMQYGISRLSVIGSTYLLCGLMDTLVGCQRGMGNTLVPMIVSVVGVCGIRIVWIYTVFAAYHTLPVLYLSYPVTWAITGVMQFVLCLILKNRIQRRAAKKAEERIPV